MKRTLLTGTLILFVVVFGMVIEGFGASGKMVVVEEVDSNAQNFKKLVSGKIDCLVADQVAASQIIRKDNLDNQVEKLEKPAAVNDARIAIAKRLGRKELLVRFNRTLEEMKKDGSYRRIVGAFISGFQDE